MKYLAIIHVYIILQCVCVNSTTRKDGYITTDTNEQEITINQLPGNPYERFPDIFPIWLQYRDDSVRHELYRDDTITTALSPALFRLSGYLPDELMAEENTEHFAFYRDGDTDESSIQTHFLAYRPNPSQAALFFGQIIINDNRYRIIPEYTTINKYKIIQYIETDHRPRTSIFSKNTNVIELLVWLAPDVYEFHANRLKLSTSGLDEWIQTFSRSLTREVDTIFNGISTVSLRVYFADVGYDTSTRSTQWFADNNFGYLLDAEASLRDFSTYLSQRKHVGLIPEYDHVVVLTRQTLAEYRSGHIKRKLAHGFSSSICSQNSGNSISIASISTGSYLQAIVQAIGIGFGIEDDFTKLPISPSLSLGSDRGMQDYGCSTSCEIQLARHLMSLETNCLLTGVSDTEFRDFLNTPRFTDTGHQSGRSLCESILGSKRCSLCKKGNCLNTGKKSYINDRSVPESNVDQDDKVKIKNYPTPTTYAASSSIPSRPFSTITTPVDKANEVPFGVTDVTILSTGMTASSTMSPPPFTFVVTGEKFDKGSPPPSTLGPSTLPQSTLPQSTLPQSTLGVTFRQSTFGQSTFGQSTFKINPSLGVSKANKPVTERTAVADAEAVLADELAACLCCQICGCEGACTRCPKNQDPLEIPESLSAISCDGDSPCCLGYGVDAG